MNQSRENDVRPLTEILMRSAAEPKPAAKRWGVAKVVAMALVSVVCCLAVAPTGCTTGPGFKTSGGIGPSGAQVTAAAIGVGAGVVVVAVLVHHASHTRKGCIVSGPNGLEVQNPSASSTLELTGDTANAKVGDVYRLHGSMVKRSRHATGNRAFAVEKLGKDMGPCPVRAGLAANYR